MATQQIPQFKPMPKYDPAISAANAAVRADLYAKEAARQLKNGNAKSASEWQALADQAKAKSTVKPPNPSTPTASSASTPKPAPSTTTAKPPATRRDWDKNPPVSDSDVIRYDREMAATTPKSATPTPAPAAPSAPSTYGSKPLPPDRKAEPFVPLKTQAEKDNGKKSASSIRADQIAAERKAIGHRPQEIKTSDIEAAKRRAASYERDREIYVKHAQELDRQGKKTEAEEMWRKAEMSDKGAKIAAKNAELMEKDKPARDSEIAAWDEKKKKYDGASEEEKKSMADIPKISEPVKKNIIDLDPTMEILNKAIPQANAADAAADAFAYTPPGAGPKMVKAYGNKHSSVMVRARAQVA
jgi:hypothetical protein